MKQLSNASVYAETSNEVKSLRQFIAENPTLYAKTEKYLDSLGVSND